MDKLNIYRTPVIHLTRLYIQEWGISLHTKHYIYIKQLLCNMYIFTCVLVVILGTVYLLVSILNVSREYTVIDIPKYN